MMEWCRDGWYDYPSGPVEDPYTLGAEKDTRVYRGGSAQSPLDHLRVSSRFDDPPHLRHPHIGVRPARELDE